MIPRLFPAGNIPAGGMKMSGATIGSSASGEEIWSQNKT